MTDKAIVPTSSPPSTAAKRGADGQDPSKAGGGGATRFAALPAPDPLPLPSVTDLVGRDTPPPKPRGPRTSSVPVATQDAQAQSHAVDPSGYVQATDRAAPADLESREVQWVRHTVIPGERLVNIAARYETTAISIATANGLGERPALRVGDSLWVAARTVPPPRMRIDHVVQSGEDWLVIATQHGVPVVHLRRWNLSHPPNLEAGTRLRVWVSQSGEAEAGELAIPTLQGTSWVPLAIAPGAVSVGLAHRGRVENGVALPEYPEIWHVRRPDEAYGSTRTLELLQRALIAFKGASGYGAPLSIGAISRKEGGRLRPHASHQSGRDIDIRLPTRLDDTDKRKPKRSARNLRHVEDKAMPEIDWAATWILARELMLTGQVEFIFLDHALQKQLAASARRAGEPEERIRSWIQWPASAREGRAPIRHSPGHDQHLHVRFRCGPADIDCE